MALSIRIEIIWWRILFYLVWHKLEPNRTELHSIRFSKYTFSGINNGDDRGHGHFSTSFQFLSCIKQRIHCVESIYRKFKATRIKFIHFPFPFFFLLDISIWHGIFDDSQLEAHAPIKIATLLPKCFEFINGKLIHNRFSKQCMCC